MRHVAHEIEEKLLVEEAHKSATESPAQADHEAALRKERLLICIDERPSAAMLIRRGRRVADYLRADCIAVYVSPDAGLAHLSQDERDAVEKHLGFARNLRIDTNVIEGRDVAATLVQFARAHQATQILMGRSASNGGKRRRGGGTLQRVVRLAQDIEITIVAERRR